MGRALKLSFFWHMHQPDYRDSDGVMKMPWVFLHAIKDYYDMPWMLSKFPDLKATFNITPPLIEQLNLYDDPIANDYFLRLWSQHPSELSDSEKNWLIKTCKSSNYDVMVKPLPRFDQLYHQEWLDESEIIDLELLFVLSWCGTFLRQNSMTVQLLIEKGQGYTSRDKSLLLDDLTVFIATILPFYGSLQQDGVISLSTTPYNHPILPLLIDMENAAKANPHAKLPDNPLSLQEDAVEQVKRSIALYKETFGIDPVGFWPAEGAVDMQSVEIYKEQGIRWIATDETILFKSLENNDRSNLYRPYQYNGVSIGFRDHGLSDLIGFTYRFKQADEAAEHFISAIEPIAENKDNTTLFVILDGENAWEFFEDNGYPFFIALYKKLSEITWCRTVTMDDVAQSETTPLNQLAPGSWIGGDFSTWSGHSEKNRAWELIYQTRRDVQNYTHAISDEIAEKIRFHFLASECSDWFWWYGDDHATDFALEFDTLFRQHLIAIYTLLDILPPADLLKPIIEHKSTASFMVKPQAPIRPRIDGRNSSFFEWIGCGSIDESRLFSTMDRVRGPITHIHYGHNDSTVFIAFEGDVSSLKLHNSKLQIIIEEISKSYTLDIGKSNDDSSITCAVGETIEIALPRKLFKAHNIVHLRFEFEEENSIVQTLPGYGALEIKLNEDYSESWFI